MTGAIGNVVTLALSGQSVYLTPMSPAPDSTIPGLSNSDGPVDEVVSLRGLQPVVAIATLGVRLRDAATAGKTLLIQLDVPVPGTPTLFRPVGEYLKDAIAEGLVASVSPTHRDGAPGFRVVRA